MNESTALLDKFVASKYILDAGNGTVTILGRKKGRPSKRFSFYQKGLKVTTASIVYRNKNKQIEHEVIRINHLPTLNQVRLHTAQLQYPGEYELKLTFTGSPNNLDALREADLANISLREYFPSIDEPEAKKEISLKIS